MCRQRVVGATATIIAATPPAFVGSTHTWNVHPVDLLGLLWSQSVGAPRQAKQRRTQRQAKQRRARLNSCSPNHKTNPNLLLLALLLRCVCLQGQFDAQDGVAGTNAWIKRLRWRHTDEFEQQEGQLWYEEPSDGATAAAAAAAGWRRSMSTLTQVVVRNAGHMVPRDQPQAALVMMQEWVESVLTSEEGPQQQGAAEL